MLYYYTTFKNLRFTIILEVCQELVYGFVNHKKLALLGINWYRLPLAHFLKNQPQNGEITGFTILEDSKAGFEQIYVDLRFSGFTDASNSLGIQDFIIKRCNVIVVEFLRANENRITFHCQIFQERGKMNSYLQVK